MKCKLHLPVTWFVYGGIIIFIWILHVYVTNSMKKRNFRLFAQTQHGLHSKANNDQGSSVERLSFGSVSSVVSSAELPRLWFVPVISVSTH